MSEAQAEPAPRSPAPRWAPGSSGRVGHGVALALVHRAIMVAAFIAGGVLLGLHRDMKEVDGRAFLMVGIVLVLGAGGVVHLGLLRLGRVSLHDLGIRREHLARDLALGVLGFGAAAAALLGSVALFHGGVDLGEIGRTVSGYTVTQRLLFLFIGVEAAIVEEAIFRGYLQPALMARLGAVAGIFVCAAFFSLYHLSPRPAALVGKLAVGLILGVLRSKDRSILPAATTHVLIWAVLGTL